MHALPHLARTGHLLFLILLLCLSSSCQQLLQPYSGPPLWQARHPDRPEENLWLFGTIHRLPYYRVNVPVRGESTASRLKKIPAMPWRTIAVRQAMRNADVLMVEMLPLSDQELLTAVQQPQHNPAEPTVVLEQLLEPDQYQDILSSAKSRGIQPELLAGSDPILAFSLFANTTPANQGPPERGADDWLMLEADLQNKPVQGLEQIQDRLLALKLAISRLQSADQAQVLVQFLNTELAELEIDSEEYQELIALWLNGDVMELERRMYRYAETLPEIYEAFIVTRNEYWAAALEKQAIEGQATGQNRFVAVGIGHMVGPGSLLTRLQSRGYQIERVQ